MGWLAGPDTLQRWWSDIRSRGHLAGSQVAYLIGLRPGTVRLFSSPCWSRCSWILDRIFSPTGLMGRVEACCLIFMLSAGVGLTLSRRLPAVCVCCGWTDTYRCHLRVFLHGVVLRGQLGLSVISDWLCATPLYPYGRLGRFIVSSVQSLTSWGATH
ncbi:hypothetical protein GE09DRAFT_370816 [Coniochaeta sp. 2T2.1]|nr:hypothetical protein GE09DRAFT_370816 [Coniochaeta sp. 2T2.1]